jgi:hypothetical protein
MKKIILLIMVFAVLTGCSGEQKKNAEQSVQETDPFVDKLDKYTTVQLTAHLSHLAEDQKAVIKILIRAGKIMDELFWYEAYGDKDALLAGISNAKARKYAEINYGPWDRLEGNKPFIDTFNEKPKGANFYPADMSKEEFEAADLPDKTSQYTLIRRNDQGELYTIWYHEAFKEKIEAAAELLREAASLAEDEGFKNYLSMRAEALLTDEYQASDFAWMDTKDNAIEVVIGPIENYEDQLFNYKSAHECFVLIKDQEWSDRLTKYAAVLPELQQNLPVADAYKQETPGSDADLNAYEAVYYAGDCNAGSKTIAINLPNDEAVQLQKGTRRLQLKNAMRAKFDQILLPIADVLIAEDQRQHITFDAFFSNTMFHEVAHGLGIKNTINGKGTVRSALQEHSSAIEEGKADILGLFMITQLLENGELEGDLNDYYTTFLAGIFRSVRFGASSAHGKANMIRFNYFKEKGAFERGENGQYRVNYNRMQEAMNSLSEKLLTLQGDGDYAGVDEMIRSMAIITPELQDDLDRLSDASIPVDIVFEQGIEVLGL